MKVKRHNNKMKDLLLILIFLFISCNQIQKNHNYKKLKTITLSHHSGLSIKAYLAINEKDQSRGLSGIQNDHFNNNEGMLFLYQRNGPRQFWMPDTYFPLEIIFLNKNLKIIHIESKVPNHPGRQEPPSIARTPTIHAMHVLEIKSSSNLAKKIKKGDQFKWEGSPGLFETVSNIHLLK